MELKGIFLYILGPLYFGGPYFGTPIFGTPIFGGALFGGAPILGPLFLGPLFDSSRGHISQFEKQLKSVQINEND